MYKIRPRIKTSAKQKRDRGRDSQPRLNPQPEGATKLLTVPEVQAKKWSHNTRQKSRDLFRNDLCFWQRPGGRTSQYQVLVFTSIWGAHTKRGGKMTLSVLFFPASGYLGTPEDCKTARGWLGWREWVGRRGGAF